MDIYRTEASAQSTEALDAKAIIQYISEAKKKTPVKVYLKDPGALHFPECQVYGNIIFGEWAHIEPVLTAAGITDYVVESDRRHSAVPLLDVKNINARIEPGAIIRDQVKIGDHAVIMMGAVINIGAVIGAGTMVDMGVVMGGRATVGENCHIGAGAVLAGVIEPPNASPVVIEDDVVIGANAVVLEGCRVGRGAIVAAGAVVIDHIPPGAVAAGTPAKVIKMKDEKASEKTALVEALRTL